MHLNWRENSASRVKRALQLKQIYSCRALKLSPLSPQHRCLFYPRRTHSLWCYTTTGVEFSGGGLTRALLQNTRRNFAPQTSHSHYIYKPHLMYNFTSKVSQKTNCGDMPLHYWYCNYITVKIDHPCIIVFELRFYHHISLWIFLYFLKMCLWPKFGQ